VLVRVGVRPAADAQHDFQVAILVLEEAKLLDRAIGIFPGVGPRVAVKVNLETCVRVGEEDGAVGLDVAKGIKDVG
jgi:hypothetical protein